MAQLIEETVSPWVCLSFFGHCQGVIESCSCTHNFLLTDGQFFRLAYMFLTLMSVMIRVPTRIKLLIHSYDEGKAVSTDNLLCRNFGLDFSKGITVLESSRTTCPLLIVACSICFAVGVDHHGVPIACRYDPGLHLDGDEPWNGYILGWLDAKSAVFGVSPSVQLSVAGYSQVEVSSWSHTHHPFALELLHSCRGCEFLAVE